MGTQTSHQILDRDSGHGMDILEHNHIQRNVDSNQGDPMMLHSKFTSNVDFANRSNNQMIDAQTQPTSMPNDPNLMSDIQNQNNHQPKPSHTGSNFHEVQLKKIRKIINARNEQRQTALHLAAFGGHVEVVRSIAATGLADPSVQDIRQETPLHLSAEAGSAETTEILLQAGALPFLID